MYEITVVASDGTNEGTLDVTVTVTDVNEGPDVSGMDTLTVSENHDAVLRPIQLPILRIPAPK